MSDIPVLRRHWHPVGAVDSFGPQARTVEVLGTEVEVRVVDGVVRAEGVAGAALRYGLVWLVLDDPIAKIPAFPEAERDGYRVIFSFDQEWRSPAPWITDNAIDIAHVNVAHAATIGDAESPRLDPYVVEPTPAGFRTRMSLSVSGVQAQGASDDGVSRREMEVELAGPFASRVAIRYPTGSEHVLFILACPIDDHRSRYIQLLARNDTEQDVAAAVLLDLDRLVVAEDRMICEGLPVDFSLDARDFVSLRCDRITLEYRRFLAAMVPATEGAR